MSGVAQLVSELTRRRVHLTVREDRLHVRAPEGSLDEPLRQAVRVQKPEICRFLRLRSRILDMSLEQFAQENSALELRIPGCTETIWWVPNSRAAEQLLRQGIGRGRIWTARELLQVWEGPPLRQEDAQTLARLKAALDCELSSIRPPDADEEEDP